MYTVYEFRKYLIPIEYNVPKEELSKFGKVEKEIFDDYPETNANHAGYTIIEGIKKFYALAQTKKD